MQWGQKSKHKQTSSPPARKKHGYLEKWNLGLFLNFKSDKCPESGKEKNRKSGIRTFENSRTTGTGRDVRLSPTCNLLFSIFFVKILEIGPWVYRINWFFCFILIQIRHKLWGRMDGTWFLRLLGFPAKNNPPQNILGKSVLSYVCLFSLCMFLCSE